MDSENPAAASQTPACPKEEISVSRSLILLRSPFLLIWLLAFSHTILAGQQTLVLQQGLEDYTGAADAYVREDDWGRPVQYTRNYGRSERLKISYHAENSPLLRFDLGDLPAGATIVSATLSLYNVTQSEGTRSIRLHRVLRDWHAGNRDNAVIDTPGAYGVTGLKAFDYYPGEGEDVLWHAIGMQPGSDLATTAESATPVGGVGWYDWDLTALVRAWTDGTPNYGITLRDPDDWEPRNARRAFLSSDYADDPSLRPKLTIVYEAAQGGGGDTAFPPEHYPTAAHPRLWLTAERLAAFEQARSLDTPQWKAFKQTCDNLIDDNPNND
ncbi:DNRLRE domain-containing protein, partial [Thiolapillus sp.]